MAFLAAAGEYPLLASLDFFADPALYFSLFPRDIARYILLGYIGAMKYPLGRAWTSPQLVQRLTLPPYYLNDLVILRNGDWLHCTYEQFTIYRLKPTDQYPGQVLWQTTCRSNSDLYHGVGYDEITDTLYFSRYGGKMWAVSKISTCFTSADVEAQQQRISEAEILTSYPSELFYALPRVGPYSDLYQPDEKAVDQTHHKVCITQVGRVVWEHKFTDFAAIPYEIKFYSYGGYLFLQYYIYPHQQLKTVLEIHRIMR